MYKTLNKMSCADALTAYFTGLTSKNDLCQNPLTDFQSKESLGFYNSLFFESQPENVTEMSKIVGDNSWLAFFAEG
jgi:hypothetical protein